MTTLLHTDKIQSTGPTRTTSMKVERFNTDNYTIRASMGFNNEEIKYSITWICLTHSEAQALVAQFKSTRGVELIQWTPPLEDTVTQFTVADYTVSLYTKQAPFTYTVTAELIKEYDII